MTAAEPFSPAARTQQRLWGSDPDAWARHAEPHNRPLFNAVLDAAARGVGTLAGRQLLDLGCGTGLLLRLARERGATVHGVDVVAGMLERAAVAEPTAALHLADLQHLPFDSSAFGVVVAVNALQFADDPVAAVAEAARVLVPGGVLVASFFDAPELSQTTIVHNALSALSPPQRASEHAPYVLAGPGNYEAALAAAGMTELDSGQVECLWSYSDVATAVSSLLSSAGGTRAVEDAGRARAAAAVADTVVPFVARDGSVTMLAVFRWVSARR
ncbi:MAG: class I SAM-dependent methyltransferase [Pseudonocardiales bacterium]